MDILEQYEKQNLEVSPQALQWESPEEYGGLTRFVIRVSMGRIQNKKQAEYVLLGFMALMIFISLFLLFGGSLGTSTDQAAIDQMLKLHPDLIKQ